MSQNNANEATKNIISCKEAARLMSEALEHELTFNQKQALAFHHAVCRLCVYYDKQIRGLRETLGRFFSFREEDLASRDVGLPDKAREQIRQRIIDFLRKQ